MPPGSSVKDLKGFIEAETNLPSASQSLYLNGQPVVDETKTLENAGINDGEMLGVVVRRTQAARPNGPQPPARPSGQPDPEGVRQQLLMNTQAQNDLRHRDPELAAAVGDPVRWRDTFTMRQRQAEEAERERQNQIALLNEDPFNVEAQRKIEELIRQDRVVENLQEAYERNPEGNIINIAPFSYTLTLRQSSSGFICSMSTLKSMACLSRLLSILVLRQLSCLQVVLRGAVSCD